MTTKTGRGKAQRILAIAPGEMLAELNEMARDERAERGNMNTTETCKCRIVYSEGDHSERAIQRCSAHPAMTEAGLERLHKAVTGHTPGPWETSRDAVPDGHTQVTVYAESDGERVATAFRNEANARLIAAAPDLLAALDQITQHTAPLMRAKDPLGFDIDRIARAAIKLARGED